jgi:trimeric autotransporter adhesin
MASTYTPLGIELMATGENAGTWGTKTNTNLQFKYASGSGSTVTFSATNKGDKLIFAKADDATNPNVVELSLSSPPGGSDTQIQFNNAGAFDGSANLVWDGTNLNIGATGEIRLQDTTGGEYVGLQASGTVSASYTLTFPAATGTADQILKTDGSGNLSFVDNSGGTAWQAVKTDPGNSSSR